MRKINYWQYFISFLMIFLIILNSLCISTNANNSKDNIKNTPKEPLNIFYLSVSRYLLPEPPGNEDTNITVLIPEQQLAYTHNIRDRKFDAKNKPELNIWLNARESKGIILNFEISIQAWEEDTFIEGKFFKILFNIYTAKGTAEGEFAKVSFLKYSGEPFDIKFGSDNYGAISLSINITGNITKSTKVSLLL